MTTKNKTIKKDKKPWKDEQPTPGDRILMNNALAAYLIDTGQTEEYPAGGITTVRAMIPYLQKEDPRWKNVIASRVTTTGCAVYNKLCEQVRNTLLSTRDILYYIDVIEERNRQEAADQEESEEEDEEAEQTPDKKQRDGIMEELKSGEATPSLKGDKQMPAQHVLGMYTNPDQVINQSSNRATAGHGSSPTALNIFTGSTAERVESYFNDMVFKIK